MEARALARKQKGDGKMVHHKNSIDMLVLGKQDDGLHEQALAQMMGGVPGPRSSKLASPLPKPALAAIPGRGGAGKAAGRTSRVSSAPDLAAHSQRSGQLRPLAAGVARSARSDRRSVDKSGARQITQV